MSAAVALTVHLEQLADKGYDKHTSSADPVDRFAASVWLTVLSLSRKVSPPAACGASVESRTSVRTTPNPPLSVSGISTWTCVAEHHAPFALYMMMRSTRILVVALALMSAAMQVDH